MDELIVRVSRAVASTTRLRILQSLAQAKEKTPTELAEELGLSKSVLSSHLRVLETAGLILRRRSGSHVYCVAGSAYDDQTLSGQVASWLYRWLRNPEAALKNCGVLELRNSEVDPAETLIALVFEAATAFANVRRVQILQRLERGGEATTATLTSELHMSEYALSRHLAKLTRRGYVVTERKENRQVCRLAGRFKTPIHRRFFQIVRSVWVTE